MTGQEVAFDEERHATAAVRALIIGLCLVAATSTVVTAWPASRGDTERTALVVGAVVLVTLGVLASTMSTTVRVSHRGVDIAFALGVTVWRRHLEWWQVRTVDLRSVSAVRAGGLGLRWLGSGTVALMVRPGPAVAIGTDAGRTYVVVTDRPTQLIAALTSGARGG